MRHNGSEPDDIRHILAEQDLLVGLKDTLRLADDSLPARDNGVAELKALMPAFKEPERTFTEAAAAQWLGMRAELLAARRRRGTGPRYHTHRGRATYTLSALGHWDAER